MSNEGLYYYKLVSPYTDDITKNCKLTVEEIDSNFLHLKNVDIKSSVYDPNTHTIILTRNDGETMVIDLTDIINKINDADKPLTVDYDSTKGTITITYGGQVTVIDGIVTKDTLNDDKKIVTDDTLVGSGVDGDPLGVNPAMQTGQYGTVIKFIDTTTSPAGQLPDEPNVGDRYVTLENVNDCGYLYNYAGVQEIANKLEANNSDWRVPTKQDWDDMLDSVELCSSFETHTATTVGNELGYLAGKFLKSLDTEKIDGNDVEIWSLCDCTITPKRCGCNDIVSSDMQKYVIVEDEDGDSLKEKEITPNGIDKYGFRVLPCGMYNNCDDMLCCGELSVFWTSTQYLTADYYVKMFAYDKAGVFQTYSDVDEKHSIRLVKDYDGTNFYGYEKINGVYYKTVLMPSDESESGYRVWMAVDYGNPTTYGTYASPCDCLTELNRKQYYINYWDGECWIKYPMSEGDSVVVATAYTDGSGHTYMNYSSGLTAVHDVEYRLVDGVLTAVNDTIYQDIIIALNREIDKLNDKITELNEKDDYLQCQIGDGFDCCDTISDAIQDTNGRYITSASTFSVKDGFLFYHNNIENNFISYLDSNYGEIPE